MAASAAAAWHGINHGVMVAYVMTQQAALNGGHVANDGSVVAAGVTMIMMTAGVNINIWRGDARHKRQYRGMAAKIEDISRYRGARRA